jgi:hypothetical protein
LVRFAIHSTSSKGGDVNQPECVLSAGVVVSPRGTGGHGRGPNRCRLGTSGVAGDLRNGRVGQESTNGASGSSRSGTMYKLLSRDSKIRISRFPNILSMISPPCRAPSGSLWNLSTARARWFARRVDGDVAPALRIQLWTNRGGRCCRRAVMPLARPAKPFSGLSAGTRTSTVLLGRLGCALGGANLRAQVVRP